MVADNNRNVAIFLPHETSTKRSSKIRLPAGRSDRPLPQVSPVFYAAFALSGGIGALVFFAKLLAGRELETTIPSLALQAGVVALMIFLYRRDQAAQDKLVNRVRDQENLKKTP